MIFQFFSKEIKKTHQQKKKKEKNNKKNTEMIMLYFPTIYVHVHTFNYYC